MTFFLKKQAKIIKEINADNDVAYAIPTIHKIPDRIKFKNILIITAMQLTKEGNLLLEEA